MKQCHYCGRNVMDSKATFTEMGGEQVALCPACNRSTKKSKRYRR